ncbi:MAG TPA: 30S ribosomal protein S20 [Anaerolineales bacterium]
MANTRSAKKRIRQNEKRRDRNKPVRTHARTQVKLARTAIEAGKPDLAAAAVKEAIQQLDRAADAGVIHRKNAARRKSRLMKRLASVQQDRG